MKRVSFPVIIFLVTGIIFIPALVHGEVSVGNLKIEKPNIGISQERPQYEGIKQKVKTLVDAKRAEEAKKRLLADDLQRVRNIVKSGDNKTSISVITSKVSAMPDMAKEQRKQLEVIRGEINKRTIQKNHMIEVLLKNSGVGKPSKDAKTIEYGRTK